MLVAVMALPVILFAIRAVKIIGSERSKLPKTAMTEVIISIPWLFVMLMGAFGVLYSFLEGVSDSGDGRYGLANIFVQLGIGWAGKYYLPIMALVTVICGCVNLKNRRTKRCLWDIIFAVIFIAMSILCWTGDIYSLMFLFDGEE